MTETPPPGRPLLLVEDDVTLADLLARHLRAHGHLVEETGSTESAIEALQGGLRPSLVLLDINLPGSSGWDLLRHPIFEDIGRPPVLVISATAVTPDRLSEFGVAGFLPKPFPLETLVTTIERLVDIRKEDESR